MTEHAGLYAWGPDRNPKFVRVQWAPFDADGDAVELFYGAAVPEEIVLHLLVEKKRIVPDFVYDIGLQLFVSDRVRAAIESFAPSNVEFRQAVVIDKRGEMLGERYWANPLTSAAIMDRSRSKFVASGPVMRKVYSFAVDHDTIPPQDLFICDDVSVPIFSERLVQTLSRLDVTGAVFTPLESFTFGFV